jgi:hypothetical protein
MIYNPLKELKIKKMEKENNKKLTMTKNSSRTQNHQLIL